MNFILSLLHILHMLDTFNYIELNVCVLHWIFKFLIILNIYLKLNLMRIFANKQIYLQCTIKIKIKNVSQFNSFITTV